MLTPEQQKVLEDQKMQCPFCKIVKGEIPAQVIYEDQEILVIADINPLTKGHMLIMPKEHYPLLPLVPPEVQSKMFSLIKYLVEALNKATVATGANIFIANGGIAGQQAMHFLFHIIPREKGDGVDNFSLKSKDISLEDKEKTIQALTRFLPQILGDKRAQLAHLIQQNPKLKDLIKHNPQEARKQIESNPQLVALFEGIDLEALGQRL